MNVIRQEADFYNTDPRSKTEEEKAAQYARELTMASLQVEIERDTSEINRNNNQIQMINIQIQNNQNVDVRHLNEQ